MDTQEHRYLPISAGHLTLTVTAELGRLMAANRKDRRKAVAAGLAELAKRKALHAKEATELTAIMEMYFDAHGGNDPKLTDRVRSYFEALTFDPNSSAAALAIASVINSLASRSKTSSGGGQHKIAAHAVSGGDVLYGGTGAVIGAGIGFGFGGPIGAGIGAVVGAAVGVCIDEG